MPTRASNHRPWLLRAAELRTNDDPIFDWLKQHVPAAGNPFRAMSPAPSSAPVKTS